MVLDGTMVIIASIVLTVMHPGIGFGSAWQEANFSFRTRKDGNQVASSRNENMEEQEMKAADVRVTDV